MKALYQSISSDFAHINLKRKYEINVEKRELPEIKGVGSSAITVALNRKIPSDELKNFFNPEIVSYMPPSDSIPDLDKAASVIVDGIITGKKFGLVGDYDVDGATSVSEMVIFLRDAGVPNGLMEFYIPQRLTEGYGLNNNAIRQLYDNGSRILIVLDSGTLSNEPLAYADELGMSIIIVDHHMPGEAWVRPHGLLVNPQLGEYENLKNLCTAGLVFLLLQKVRELLNKAGYTNIPSLIKLSGLASLGTVADLMTLVGLNRALVAQGIPHLDDVLGLSALVSRVAGKIGERTKVNTRTLGFGVGPCINAAGRISDCMKGSQLLTSENSYEATDMANELFEINKERQDMQRKIEASAIEMAIEQADDTASVIIVRNEEWHPGVIGIIASRIMNMLDRPSLVIGEGGKGSGRSIQGFDLGTAIIQARNNGLIYKGGGHALACGLTVDPDKYDEFFTFMKEKTKDIIRLPHRADLVLPLHQLTVSLVRDLESLAPFGQGNPEPRIILTDCMITGHKWIGKNSGFNHLRLMLESNGVRYGAVYFSAKDTLKGDFLSGNIQEKRVSLVVSVSLNLDFPSNPIDIKISDIVEQIN